MAEIVLDEVTKRFPDGALAVDKISLEIADGEFVILVGPSGCGKSTTLNMIAGLEDISSGELRIGGQVVNNKSPKDRDIAMVFQSYALYPHMTVRQNMGFALKLAKTPQATINEKVEEAARILDLTQHLDRKPANLSGGQRQRVAMGRAIVRNPAVFLMDEPLSNLDAKLRVQMRTEVSRIQRRLGTTTVYVTHDQTEAMTLGDRVAVMRTGVLQQVGSPKALYDTPVNLFVAGFIGSPAMNFISGTFEEGMLRTPLGDFRLGDRMRREVESAGAGREVIVGMRPEIFEDAALVPAENRQHGVTFRAGIDVLESMGSDVFVYFTKGIEQGVNAAELEELARDSGRADTGGSGDTVVARLDAATGIREGQDADLWVDARAMHIFDPSSGRNLSLGTGDGARAVTVGATQTSAGARQTAAEGWAGEPAGVAARPAPRQPRREEVGTNSRTREKEKDGSGDRYLVGRVQEKVEAGREFFLSLQVKVTRPEPAAGVSQSQMRVDRGGDLLAVLVADPLFSVLTDDKVIVPVPQKGEGPEKGFTLRPQHAGAGWLRVDVHRGTQALTTFRFRVTASTAHAESETQSATVGIPQSAAPQGLMKILLAGRKERTIQLVVGETYLPDHTLEIGEPEISEQLQQVTAQLNEFADGTAGGSITTKRLELYGLGKQLYDRLLPGPFVEEFRAHRRSATSLAIQGASSLPWELMADSDEGTFLAEELRVTRWLNGSQPGAPIRLRNAIFACTDGVDGARAEIEQIGQLLHPGRVPAVIPEAVQLQEQMKTGDFDLFHFAGHTKEDKVAKRTSLEFGNLDDFTHNLMASVPSNSLERLRPIIFLNACGSASRIGGRTLFEAWAEMFIKRGAGAFIGSLWNVRSDTANTFGIDVYRSIQERAASTLGEAVDLARRNSKGDPSDPTRLAYALYGKDNAKVI